MTGNLVPSARAEGIPVGKAILYPSIEAVWQNENNLFLSNVDQEAATSYALRPRIQWELPFRESHLRMGYSPQVRTFEARDTQATGLKRTYYSHYADLDSKLVFSRGLVIQVRDEFISDALETIHFDPGQSVPFGNNNQYQRNRAEFEAVKPVGDRHGAGIQALHEFLNFDDRDVPLFLDYSRAGGGLVYLYRPSPLSQLKVSYVFTRVDQQRPGSLKQDFATNDVLIRLEGAVGRNGLTESTLGYTRWNFNDPSQNDFAGITGEIRYRLLLTERMRLSSTLARFPLQSSFNVNDYYITRNLDLRLESEPGAHLFYNVAAGYRLNDFPQRVVLASPAFDGVRRDRIWRGEVGIGYKFVETLRAEIRYRHERRLSNLDDAEYGSNRVAVQLSFGWR